jgi:hypothetical protein
MALGRPRYPPITREAFEASRGADGPHRICFASTHAKQPCRLNYLHYVGALQLPFLQSAGVLAEAVFNCSFRPSQQFPGFWLPIATEPEFARVQAWTKAQGTRVFLKDCLDLSLALDVNLKDGGSGPEGYTATGALEHAAKSRRDQQALSRLSDAFCETIRDLPRYRDARLIAAVPPRPGKDFDLPQSLAARVARKLSLEDLTSRFAFAGVKGTVKETSLAEKWRAWESACLTFAPPLSDEPSIILIDDKYQSGATLHFVASVLRAAGAGPIYGLCAVKTWRDTDNA